MHDFFSVVPCHFGLPDALRDVTLLQDCPDLLAGADVQEPICWA